MQEIAITKGAANMIICQLKQEQYDAISNTLYTRAYTDECSASHTIAFDINHTHYILRLQLERHRKIAIAIKEAYIGEEPHYELITANTLLSALLELFIDQTKWEEIIRQ